MSEKRQNYIELKGIKRFFGPTKALDGVDFTLSPGEVVGLVGPNGAGKSTLVKIITGVLPPTEGSITVHGTRRDNYSALEALESGISCAYQDFSLCTNLSVYENFAMLDSDQQPLSLFKWRKKSKSVSEEILKKYFPGSNVDINTELEELSLAEKQIVEICKALFTENLKVLILDEPTSALSTELAKQLHELVATVSAQGVAVIYISHKLDEILDITDRIVVLQNGRTIVEYKTENITYDELVYVMGGGKAVESALEVYDAEKTRDKIIEISNYSDKSLKNLNFTLGRGEIVGISGLDGSGQEELLDLIFFDKGKNPNVKINGSISFISGDRAKEGIFRLWDIGKNILISSLDQVKGKLLIDQKKSDNLAQEWYDKLQFKAEGINSPITSLSGGNQQKALIARGLSSGSDIILLKDPTAGVDIETKEEIYELLREAAKDGKSIVLYSTEDSEMAICDRVYVLREYTISQELIGNEVSVANIVKASFEQVDTKEIRSVENKKNGFVSKLLNSRLLLPVITLILMLAINGYLNPNLLSYFGVSTLSGSALPLVFASIGQMFIVLCGDIDMGNGYSIGLINVLIAVVMTQNPLVGIVSLLIFLISYVVMGAIIHIRKIPAIVVTLGAQFIWLGVALLISPTPGGTAPEWLTAIFYLQTPIIPSAILTAIITAIIAFLIVYRLKYGVILRALGNNKIALERSGWSALQAKCIIYAISGVFVVLSGMAYTAVSLGSDANSAASLTMLSIATIILGGCEFSGGIVEPIGVVVASFAMSMITTLLIALKIDSNFQTAVTGFILIAVLALKTLSKRRKQNEQK